jgi:hypothetical protein
VQYQGLLTTKVNSEGEKYTRRYCVLQRNKLQLYHTKQSYQVTAQYFAELHAVHAALCINSVVIATASMVACTTCSCCTSLLVNKLGTALKYTITITLALYGQSGEAADSTVTVAALRTWHDEFGDHSDKGLVIDAAEDKKHALIARCSSPNDQIQWAQV